jgi:hypothetical protein
LYGSVEIKDFSPKEAAMRNVGHPVSLTKALWRGFTMRCPNCGEGKLFGRFLKVADHCAVCGEDFTPQRADDFPSPSRQFSLWKRHSRRRCGCNT